MVRKLRTFGADPAEPHGGERAPALADHDARSLAAWLRERTARDPERCLRAARRVLRHAFARDHLGDAEWSEDALRAANIGAWARVAVRQLSPRVGLTIAERAPSADGTERLLLRAGDGSLIEAVIIPAEAGRDRPRTTLCLSSQVGCARACTFCETGSLGLSRQLSPAEIVDQYRIARRICEGPDRPADRRGRAREPHPSDGRRAAERPISNIVFMGMGEPFDNLAAVTRAIALLTEPHAFAFAPSRITVSTVGVADKLPAFFASTRAELAISLNAPDDARRDRIMPINRRVNLAELRAALVASLPPGRRVLFQYALFAGFNDALEDADRLAELVQAIRCRVNVIPANPGPDPELVAPSPERVDAFVARLHSRGVTTLVRRPRGRDVGGACGQLAGSRRAELGGSGEVVGGGA